MTRLQVVVVALVAAFWLLGAAMLANDIRSRRSASRAAARSSSVQGISYSVGTTPTPKAPVVTREHWRAEAADELRNAFTKGHGEGKEGRLDSDAPCDNSDLYGHHWSGGGTYDPLKHQLFQSRLAGWYAGQRQLRADLNLRVSELETSADEAKRAAKVKS